MQLKVLSLLACIIAINGGILPESTSDTYDAHPVYNFKYSVEDSITGDVKDQTESRDGDNLQGRYSLNDADGYKRIVDYTSDAVNGFKVSVRRERLDNAPVKKIVAKDVLSKPKEVIVAKPKLVTPKKSVTTIVHHHQPTVYHHAPETVHFLHSAPSATAIVKSAPALITTTHHHSPAIVRHTPTVVHHAPAALVQHTPALVKTSISTPHHVSYVHYH